MQPALSESKATAARKKNGEEETNGMENSGEATKAAARPGVAQTSFLIYVSIATQPFTETELLDLLTKSRKNNAAVGVTGMLLYKEGKFMQLLEGEEAQIRRTFEKISRDPRHHHVITLLQGQEDARVFAEWQMGFADLDHAAAEAIPGYSEYLNTPLTADAFPNPSNAQRLLRMFKRSGLSL